jgi:hypothetical protein
MSTANSARVNTTAFNPNASNDGTMLAVAPAVGIAARFAAQAARAAARVAIKYGRRYAPIAASGFTVGAGAGYVGLDPQDATTMDTARTAAWATYQRLDPTRAALPGAKVVFDQSFNLGVRAGQAARTYMGSANTTTSRDIAVALKDTTAGQSGSNSFVAGAASVNTRQTPQRQAPSVGIA